MSRFQNEFTLLTALYTPQEIVDPGTGEVLGFYPRRPWQRLRVQAVPVGESRVIDSFVDQTDINKIVARFDRTGVLPEGKLGQYVDVVELQGNYSDLFNKAQDTMARADDLNIQASAAKRAKAAPAKVETVPPPEPPAPPADSVT